MDEGTAPALPLAVPEQPEPPDGEAAPGPPRITCRLCGRPLTGQEARRRGIGEGCRAKLRERTAPRPPAHEVEQEPLPGL